MDFLIIENTFNRLDNICYIFDQISIKPNVTCNVIKQGFSVGIQQKVYNFQFKSKRPQSPSSNKLSLNPNTNNKHNMKVRLRHLLVKS